jgi:hypothetical protein
VGRLLLLVVAIAVVVLVAYAITSGFERSAVRRRGRRATARGWVVETRKAGQETVVRLERGDEDPYVIGAVSIDQPHWEYVERLEELRVEAQDKADALNRRLPR